MNALLEAFDPYSRVARLCPAALAVIPEMLTVTALGVGPESTLPQVGYGLLVGAAVFTLLINVARSRGKLLEPSLLDSWGGWPSTTLLRHRDTTIEAPTKARYHKKLQEIVGELVLPTATDELASPAAADEVYRSATKLLIEKRRGSKFKLLHRENALYGFRRNLLGLKPIALVLLGLTATAEAILWVRATTPPVGFAFAVGINVVSVLAWWLVVRPGFVRQASNEYAFALLRTLDA